MRYKQTVSGMSERLRTLRVNAQKCISGSIYWQSHEIVVEVPRGSLKQRQSVLVGQDFTEKAIALDLARDVALKTATPFPAIGEGAAGLYDEDRPIWYEYRHRVMNQRPCDHEERGIRAWKIA
jgi:hypothetical protein